MSYDVSLLPSAFEDLKVAKNFMKKLSLDWAIIVLIIY